MASNFSEMIESFKIEGYWWLPDSPEKKIPGYMEYSPEKISLNLMGSFQDLKDFNKVFDPQIILGTSMKGSPITLFNCYSGTKTFGTGIPKTSFHVLYFFDGIHFNNTEEIKFKSLLMYFSNLDNWVGVSGFHTDFPNQNSIVTTFTQPNSLHAKIDEELKLDIGFDASHSFNLEGPRTISMKQKAVVTIESNTEKTFLDFLKVQGNIRNFLSLATLTPIFPLKLVGRTELNKKTEGELTIYPEIGIYYNMIGLQSEIKKTHSMKMLFTLNDIRDDFEKYIKTWYEKKEKLGEVVNLYFGTLYNPSRYLIQEFLSIITSLEAYHRRFGTNFIWSDEEFKKIQSQVISSVDSEYNEWVKNKFQYGNEPSLRKRLKDFLEQFKVHLEKNPLFGSKFVDDVVNTRNYYTHYDNELKEKKMNDNEIFPCIQMLRVLMEICFLSELGFPHDKITLLVQKSIKEKYVIK